MAQNLYSDISSFVNTVWEDATLVLREQGPMVGLVRNFSDLNSMALRKNATYGTATINQIGEADDLASQAFNPTVNQTLTPYEYGAQFFVNDQRTASDIYDWRSDARQELYGNLGGKIDGFLSGLFSSLTAGTVGGTSTNLTWANVFAAMTKARIAKIPRPWVCVLSPAQYHCLGTAIAPGVTVTNSPMAQDTFMRQFYMNTVAGMDIVVDGNIAEGTSVYGGLFNRDAVAFDLRRAPRIEVERDASRRGYELNFTTIFAYGVWRPDLGIAITTAGTAPV